MSSDGINREEEVVGAERLNPGTEIPGTGGATVGDFWAWAQERGVEWVRCGTCLEKGR